VESGADGRIEPAVDDVTSEAFFRAHYPRLAGWCRRLVDDDDTAHEIASEAFTRLLAKRRQLDDPRSYLYTIAANLVRDHWRRTQRERRGLRHIIAGRPEQSIRPPGPDSELRLLVETLPDKLRGPVLLHYFGDFSIDDVARMLGRKAGTVKSQLFDARAVLRTALEDPAVDEPRPHHPQDRP
jgi:RNA polymerase sigma-70 factor (ECF subfamily)